MNLRNKVVLITGASTGIGKSIAAKLTVINCKLILIARRDNLLYRFLEEYNIPSERAMVFKCDVTRIDQIAYAAAEGYRKFGRIDVCILNAGTSYRTKPEEFEPEKGKEIVDVNFFGIVNSLQVLLPYLKKQGSGIIAGVSSLAESRGFPKSGFYSSSKAAVSLLLESLRIELKYSDIKVITVKPGFVRTPMTDRNEFRMPLLMEPEKAADIIIRGIEKEKRIIQFPLPIVLISKFLKIIPDAIFEWLAAKHLTSSRMIFLKKKPS